MSNIYEPTITFDPPSNDNESEDILSLNKIDLKSLGIPEHLLTNNEPTLKIGPARSTTLHQELTDKGWYLKKSNNSYYGRIQGNKKRYEGCLYYIGGGRYDLYIRHPPQAFMRGKHSMCMKRIHGGWVGVHFAKGESPLEKIFTVQELIRERGG